MKEVTKTFKVYSFEELKKDIQEKLIEKEAEEQQDIYCNDCLYDDLMNEAEILLEKYFGKKAQLNRIYYDLSYSQGSGAIIEFELEYYGHNIKVIQSSRYYHEYAFSLNYEGFLGEKREEKLKDKIVEMNKELAKIGYSLIDYDNFIDVARDYLEEQNFLENGEIFDE